jgi:hypothetical protein
MLADELEKREREEARRHHYPTTLRDLEEVSHPYLHTYMEVTLSACQYTTCLVHALSSRNLPMLKGVYINHTSTSNFYFNIKKFSKFPNTKVKFFLEFISDFDYDLYLHLLT